MQYNTELLVKILLIAGALNWGLVAAMDYDLVKVVASYIPDDKKNFLNSERIIKLAVGLAGLAGLGYLYKKL